MSVVNPPWKSAKSRLATLVCISYFFFSATALGQSGALADAQALCKGKLGAGAIAVEDFSLGESSYVCDCVKSFVWSESGTACVKRQLTGVDEPDQLPLDDSQAPLIITGDDDPPPENPVVTKKTRKKVKRKPPARRKKATSKTKNKKRAGQGSAATAHRYCRRRYGRRLVNVRVKRSKFYCHYHGKKAFGYNKRVKWKKFKFRNIR